MVQAPFFTRWLSRHNPWFVAWIVTLATFMEILDTSIANVALPHISGDLSAGVEESTWVLTSYLVANAVILPLSGWFSSWLGRKRFYMICVAVFTVSSFLCGLAPNIETLVFFRILQGLGGGGLQPSEQAILVDSFPPQKLSMGMAMYGFAVVTAPIIGPTLGGWITDNYSWRWIFYINIPVGILSLFLTSQFVFDPPHLQKKKLSQTRIDYLGILLITLGIASLQVVLDTGERRDWFESSFILFFTAVTAIALLVGGIWEWRHKEPAVDVKLLKDRNFLVGNLLMFMLGFILFGSTVLLPLFLQTLMGYPAMTSGLVLSPGGLVTMLMMPIVGLLVARVQARWLVGIGLLITAVSLIHMASFNLEIDFNTAMHARALQSLGIAFLFIPINSAALFFIQKHQLNNATGLINLSRNIGGSVGIAFVTTLLTRRSQVHHAELIHSLNPTNPAYQEIIAQLAKIYAKLGSFPALANAQAHQLLDLLVQKQATMLAFLDNFWILGILFGLMIPVIFLMKKTRPGKGTVSVH